MSKIPPEAYERLDAMEDCLRRLGNVSGIAEPELTNTVRRMMELTAELRVAMEAIDGEENNGA